MQTPEDRSLAKPYFVVQTSVSQPPGRGPVPGPGINYTGPREAWANYNMLQDFISPVDN